MALIPCQVLRAAILLSYLSVLCHYKAIEMPAHQTYGGSWKFLTFIDLTCRSTPNRKRRKLLKYIAYRSEKIIYITSHSTQRWDRQNIFIFNDTSLEKKSNIKPAGCDFLDHNKTLSYRDVNRRAIKKYFLHFPRIIHVNEVIQAVFFGICVLSDLSCLLTKGSDNREQERQLIKLISLRDWMMAVLAFPVGVFVVTMFWALYIYDRELVYPKLLDNFIPPWLNHGMHTTVLPFILIEMRTTHHQYPSRTSGIATVCGFSICYILWVCWVHHVTGVWVYPLLEYISPLAKIVFFLLVTAIINIYYVLGEKLNSYIWDLDKSMEAADKRIKAD